MVSRYLVKKAKGPAPLAAPRFVLAAATSGSGKTTISIGMMAAFRARGLGVAPFKVGPDYIDPGYHTLAAGRVGRNLDPHLCGEELMLPLFRHGFERPQTADLAVVEGVMGLFDGKLGTGGFGSTAHIARLLDAPVILVISGGHSSRSLGAVAHGMATFDPRVRVAGIVLNQVSSPRLERELVAAMDDAGLPVLGSVPKTNAVVVPSRHLGLVPAAEREQAQAAVSGAAGVVEKNIDLDAVLALARKAAPVTTLAWNPGDHVRPAGLAGTTRPRIAIAGGRAFTFRYAETVELLEAGGCEVIEFDPMSTDQTLPDNLNGIYLGGGFPEIYATELAANATLRAQIKTAVEAGLPTVAECAGMLYLARSLDGTPMIDTLPVRAQMGRLTLGYHAAVATSDSMLTRTGEQIRAHEFHKTQTQVVADLPPGVAQAWDIDGRAEGFAGPNLLASYQHIHWAGHPELAQRFIDAAATFDPTMLPAAPAKLPRYVAPDLNHHGDQDIAKNLVDFAVNVRNTAPPAWLRDRLVDGAKRWAFYPDATAARQAIAERHQVSPDMVLPTAGGAEAFMLIARSLATKKPMVVHPQFTEPEAALRAQGKSVARWVLTKEDGFRFPADLSPADASDLIIVGNPTNPTSVLHPAATLRQLLKPGRIVVVDEAFMDAVLGEPETMIAPDMPGLLVIRSLTKTWSLAGIRAGYVVGDPELIAQLTAQQPPWSVSAPAIDAMIACSDKAAMEDLEEIACDVVLERNYLIKALTGIGFETVPDPRGPFVLINTQACGNTSIREAMAGLGFAVRRGESFPGLGPTWIRLAVRHKVFVDGLIEALASLHTTPPEG